MMTGRGNNKSDTFIFMNRPVKKSASMRDALDEFHELQAEYPQKTQEERVQDQPLLVSRFYDFVTRFYEYGWGTSFHFAPRIEGETLASSQYRQEKELAELLGLHKGMLVADIGCGIGGPLVNIATVSGAHITGVNISEIQIQRGRELVRQAGLGESCDFLHADYLHVPLADDHFDALYSFEAICHASDRHAVMKELFRILKPGGQVGIVDWCLTEDFDPDNSSHQDLRSRFEYANATPDLFTVQQQMDAMAEAGFDLLYSVDQSLSCDPVTPWYLALQSRDFSIPSFARSPAGRSVVAFTTRLLEVLRIAPAGTAETSRLLNCAADTLVEAGMLGIFTPSFLVHARKPV